MVNEKRAWEFLKRFYEARPKEFYKSLDDHGRGVCAVLRMLSLSDGQVLAGDIASELHMSTPRVAASLKTLEGKGYIERAVAESDARKTVVRITSDGNKELARVDKELAEFVDYLMETVGEHDMNELLRISDLIARALDKKFRENKENGRQDV